MGQQFLLLKVFLEILENADCHALDLKSSLGQINNLNIKGIILRNQFNSMFFEMRTIPFEGCGLIVYQSDNDLSRLSVRHSGISLKWERWEATISPSSSSSSTISSRKRGY